MILVAGRATLEVCPHAGQRRVGVRSGDFEIDVLIDQLEALLAGDLRADGSEGSP